MSKTPAPEKTVTVALNCSVKVSDVMYAPDDVIEVSEEIARRLIAQKAAEPYVLPAEPIPDAEATEEDDEDVLDDVTDTSVAVEADAGASKPKDGKQKPKGTEGKD